MRKDDQHYKSLLKGTLRAMQTACATMLLMLLFMLYTLGAKAQGVRPPSDNGIFHEGDSTVHELHFQVGSTNLEESYMSNQSVLADLKRTLSRNGAGNIKYVSIHGWASPEGDLEHNLKLSKERTANVRQHLQQMFPWIGKKFQSEPMGEQWDYIRYYVSNDRNLTAEQKKQTLSIINDSHLYPDVKKSMMKKLPFYQYILENYYVRSRNVTITTVFGKPLDKPVKVIHKTDTVFRTDTIYIEKEEETEEVKSSRGVIVALKTNLLYDAALIGNIGAEIPIGKNFSIGGFWHHPWFKNDHSHCYWQSYGAYLEGRYWWGQRKNVPLSWYNGTRPLTGHHIGIYGQMLTYDVEWGKRGYQGRDWHYGGGISYGYAIPIARRWNLDFSLGIGYLQGEFREYLPMDGHYVYQKTRQLRFFGPTKAEVTLVFNIGGDARKANERKLSENVSKATKTTKTTMKGGAR